MNDPIEEERLQDGAAEAKLRWLLLVHHLPTEPSRIRVKVWRRLQNVGAVAVKSSVYVLPDTPEAREDFEWIRVEVVAQGGEAMVFAADAVDGVSSAEIRETFERARRSDWQALLADCEEVLNDHPSRESLADEELAGLRRQVRTLRARAARIESIDYLRSAGRGDALSALARIERLLDPAGDDPSESGSAKKEVERYRGRVWLTRPRPAVDRMASAWLIRRFIDPDAQFRFAERIPQDEDVVPFDMFGVDLGHRGENVTFETLLGDFGLADPALARLARIVHELDLKVEPYSDIEASTVERLVDGLRSSCEDDDRLLGHGIALFEALYQSFSVEGWSE